MNKMKNMRCQLLDYFFLQLLALFFSLKVWLHAEIRNAHGKRENSVINIWKLSHLNFSIMRWFSALNASLFIIEKELICWEQRRIVPGKRPCENKHNINENFDQT